MEGAADPSKHKESAKKYGAWDVPKTYVHLWGRKPDPYGLAPAACRIRREDRHRGGGGEYDNGLFGLWRTTVGPDVEKNDLFENIPAR